MAKTFSAQVDDWILKSREALEAVIKESAQDVFDIALTPVAKGGNMPVDTGFLRNSFVVSLNAPVNRVTFNTGTVPALNDYVLAIAAADLGDLIYGTFTANYAGYVHYGTNGRPGRLFVDLAAQQWPQIVARNAAKLGNA